MVIQLKWKRVRLGSRLRSKYNESCNPVVTRAARTSRTNRIIEVICPLLPPRVFVKSRPIRKMVGRGGGDRTHIPNRPPPFTNRGPLCGDFFDRNYRLYRDSARSTLARSKLWVRRISKYPSLLPKHSLWSAWSL